MKYDANNERKFNNIEIKAMDDSTINSIIIRESEGGNSEIVVNGIMPLKDAKAMVERVLITRVMDKVKSTYKAAEILQVSQATIARKSKIYNDELLVGQ